MVGFYDHTIDLQSKGKFITDVVQFGIAPGEVVLVKAAADLATGDDGGRVNDRRVQRIQDVITRHRVGAAPPDDRLQRVIQYSRDGCD